MAQCSFYCVSVHIDPWNTVFEKLVVAHPIKIFPSLGEIVITESKWSCHYSVLRQMKPVNNHCMSLRSVFVLSFYLSVFQLASDLQFIQPKLCMHFSSFQCMHLCKSVLRNKMDWNTWGLWHFVNLHWSPIIYFFLPNLYNDRQQFI